MDRDEIFAKVVDIVNDTLSIADDVELVDATNLRELGADSFDLLELVTTIEDEFGLTLDDEAVSKVSTVGEVVDSIVAVQ